MKKRIRLNESAIRRIVKESVKRVLREFDMDNIHDDWEDNEEFEVPSKDIFRIKWIISICDYNGDTCSVEHEEETANSLEDAKKKFKEIREQYATPQRIDGDHLGYLLEITIEKFVDDLSDGKWVNLYTSRPMEGRRFK